MQQRKGNVRKTALIIALGLATMAHAQQLQPPMQIHAFDTPNDAGGSITVTWPRWESAPEGTGYRLYIAESSGGPFHLAAQAVAPALMSDDLALFGYDDENENYHFLQAAKYEIE